MKPTPPMWLRRLFPWRLLYFINNHAKVCMMGVAMWKNGYDGWTWWPTSSCWDGPNEGYDYCGKWERVADWQRDTGLTPSGAYARTFPVDSEKGT